MNDDDDGNTDVVEPISLSTILADDIKEQAKLQLGGSLAGARTKHLATWCESTSRENHLRITYVMKR